MDEFGIIAKYFAPLAGKGAFGLADDAAVIAPRPGHDLVVTTDAIMDGVDFFADDPPGTIARKALRVNLSDLAAKGAEPFGYLLGLTLPKTVTPQWLEAFASGLAADQEQFEVALLGGDTGAGPLAIAITAFGYVQQGRMIRRSGARPGDAVYVTGSIGDSGGGLDISKGAGQSLSAIHRNALVDAYRLPKPPVQFGFAARKLFHAAIDISDGLIADLGHLAESSGVGIVVEGEAVPRSLALRSFWGEGVDALVRAVTAGDDYQIAFTTAARDTKIRLEASSAGIEVTRIGTVTAGEGVHLLIAGAEVAVPRPGYRHF